MKKAFIQSFILLVTLFLSSCVTIHDESASTVYSEKWCYYDFNGIYRCTTCYGSECTCNISAYDLCSFGTWERACRACYESRYSDFTDLYGDPRLSACSPLTLCNLCSAGNTACGPYPRAEWSIHVYTAPPPPPPIHYRRHRRGRPDDYPEPPPPKRKH